MARPSIGTRAEANTYGLPQGAKIRAALRRFFAEQRRAVLRWLVTGKTKEVATKADAPPDIPAGPFPGFDAFGLGNLAMAERMTPLIAAIWEDAGQAFAPRVGLDPDAWKVESPQLQEAIDKAVLAFADSTNRTTSLAIDDAIKQTRQAIREGITGQTLSYDELTKRINAIFETATVSRARRIAVTEAARAYHQSQEMAAEKSGVVSGWKWLASSDACPLCRMIARECPFVRLGQDFAVIGTDPNYSRIRFPPCHPHCQCSMVEVLDIDTQPEWSNTLIQPEPPPEEDAEGKGLTHDRTQEFRHRMQMAGRRRRIGRSLRGGIRERGPGQ